MKKRKSNIKIPAYVFGIDIKQSLKNMLDVAPQAAQTFGSAVTASAEEGSKDAVAGSTISGAGTGAAIGLQVAGPWGAAIGAVGGGLTGLFTGRKRRREIQAAKRRQRTMQGTERGLQQEADMADEYWDDNAQAYTFENGGIHIKKANRGKFTAAANRAGMGVQEYANHVLANKNSSSTLRKRAQFAKNAAKWHHADGGYLDEDLAYLDDDEVIRDFQGNISHVPDTHSGTDTHLVDATNLESVLSDKIKNPVTNKTFAQEGKKLLKITKPSKGKDTFAENTDKLNRITADYLYDNLIQKQEMVKLNKGIKGGKRKSIPAYDDGFFQKAWNYVTQPVNPLPNPVKDTEKNRQLIASYFRDNPDRIREFSKIQWYNPDDPERKTYYLDPKKNYENDSYLERAATQYRTYEIPEEAYHPKAPRSKTDSYTLPYEDPNSPYYIPDSARNVTPRRVQASTPAPRISKAPRSKTDSFSGKDVSLQDYLNSLPETEQELPYMETPYLTAKTPRVPSSSEIRDWDVDWENQYGKFKPKKSKKKGAEETTSDSSGNNNALSNLLELTPTFYNMIQGMRGSEYDQAVFNPYTGSVRNSLARRRYNIEPIKAANRRSRAYSNYNLANLSANTGANLAARTQAANSEYANNASLYGTKQNQDNAYLADYANSLNNLGQQWVTARNLQNDNNARNRAAARNYLGSAASQVGKWAQTQQQMRNQFRRDAMIWPYLANYLSQGYTDDMINDTTNRVLNYGK